MLVNMSATPCPQTMWCTTTSLSIITSTAGPWQPSSIVLFSRYLQHIVVAGAVGCYTSSCGWLWGALLFPRTILLVWYWSYYMTIFSYPRYGGVILFIIIGVIYALRCLIPSLAQRFDQQLRVHLLVTWGVVFHSTIISHTKIYKTSFLLSSGRSQHQPINLIKSSYFGEVLLARLALRVYQMMLSYWWRISIWHYSRESFPCTNELRHPCLHLSSTLTCAWQIMSHCWSSIMMFVRSISPLVLHRWLLGSFCLRTLIISAAFALMSWQLELSDITTLRRIHQA